MRCHIWTGKTGRYEFEILPFSRKLPVTNAVYVFARHDLRGCWPLYFGEAADLWDRFSNHEKFQAAELRGANAVHVFRCASYSERLRIETDLRRGNWTPLNEQSTPAYPVPPANPFPQPPASPFSIDALAALGAEPPFPFANPLAGLVRNAPPPPPNPMANALAALAYPRPEPSPVARALAALVNPEPTPYSNALAALMNPRRR